MSKTNIYPSFRYPKNRWKVEKKDNTTGKWYTYLKDVIADYGSGWTNGDVIKAYGDEDFTLSNPIGVLPNNSVILIDMAGFSLGTTNNMTIFTDGTNTVTLKIFNANRLYLNTTSDSSYFFYIGGVSSYYIQAQRVEVSQGLFAGSPSTGNMKNIVFDVSEFYGGITAGHNIQTNAGGKMEWRNCNFYLQKYDLSTDLQTSATVDAIDIFTDCKFIFSGTIINQSLRLGTHRPAGTAKVYQYFVRCKVDSGTPFVFWQNQNPAYGVYVEFEDCDIISRGIYDAGVYYAAIWLVGDSTDSKYVFKGINNIWCAGLNVNSIGHNGTGTGLSAIRLQGFIFTNLPKMSAPTFLVNPSGFVVSTDLMVIK